MVRVNVENKAPTKAPSKSRKKEVILPKEYSPLPTTQKVMTVYGPIIIAPQAADRILVQTPDPGLTFDDRFEVNKVGYQLRAHFIHQDGRWFIADFKDLWIARVDGGGTGATVSARGRIAVMLTQVLETWVAANPHLIRSAEKALVGNEILALKQHLESLREEVKIAAKQVGDLADRYASL